MNAEKANFGRYGKTFQEGLVQLIFEDRPFADQITEVLDTQFLELEYLNSLSILERTLTKILLKISLFISPKFLFFSTIFHIFI